MAERRVIRVGDEPVAVGGSGWWAAPNTVFGPRGLAWHERLVLLYLYRVAGPDGAAWPGRARIAADCEMSVSQVIRALRGLESKGWIEVTYRVDAHGGQTSNVYRLLHPVRFQAAPESVPRRRRSNVLLKQDESKQIDYDSLYKRPPAI